MSGQPSKLKRVNIRYKDWEVRQNEWDYITVEFTDGRIVDIQREQIEAFKRMESVIRDFQEIERVRDSLVKIFGNAPITPMTPKPMEKENET